MVGAIGFALSTIVGKVAKGVVVYGVDKFALPPAPGQCALDPVDIAAGGPEAGVKAGLELLVPSPRPVPCSDSQPEHHDHSARCQGASTTTTRGPPRATSSARSTWASWAWSTNWYQRRSTVSGTTTATVAAGFSSSTRCT